MVLIQYVFLKRTENFRMPLKDVNTEKITFLALVPLVDRLN